VRISAALPIGVTALLFESARTRREGEGRLAELLQKAGYGEVILPILDYLEPYEALLTAASRGELYRFIDRDGEQLALRGDFTPMLARLLAPRLASMTLPLRIFYRGDVVRYEEERAGRHREFYQMGAELLGAAGEDSEAAEREVLHLFLQALAPDVTQRIQIVLSFAGALDELLLTAKTGDPAALAAAVARRERGAVRQGCPALLPVVRTGLPERPEDLGPSAAGRLKSLLALRDELAARFPAASLSVDLAEFALHRLDPRIQVDAGERSYYDGIVFRAFAGAASLPVGGGGRYDSLFRRLGAEVSAVGFSINLERLIEAQSVPAGREEEA